MVQRVHHIGATQGVQEKDVLQGKAGCLGTKSSSQRPRIHAAEKNIRLPTSEKP